MPSGGGWGAALQITSSPAIGLVQPSWFGSGLNKLQTSKRSKNKTPRKYKHDSKMTKTSLICGQLYHLRRCFRCFVGDCTEIRTDDARLGFPKKPKLCFFR